MPPPGPAARPDRGGAEPIRVRGLRPAGAVRLGSARLCAAVRGHTGAAAGATCASGRGPPRWVTQGRGIPPPARCGAGPTAAPSRRSPALRPARRRRAAHVPRLCPGPPLPPSLPDPTAARAAASLKQVARLPALLSEPLCLPRLLPQLTLNFICSHAVINFPGVCVRPGSWGEPSRGGTGAAQGPVGASRVAASWSLTAPQRDTRTLTAWPNGSGCAGRLLFARHCPEGIRGPWPAAGRRGWRERLSCPCPLRGAL